MAFMLSSAILKISIHMRNPPVELIHTLSQLSHDYNCVAYAQVKGNLGFDVCLHPRFRMERRE